MMKRIVLCVLFVLSASGCSRVITQEPLFIDSNVSADVYSGDKKIGTTPFLATLEPNKTEYLSLRKKGYKTQQIKIEKRLIYYRTDKDKEKGKVNYRYYYESDDKGKREIEGYYGKNRKIDYFYEGKEFGVLTLILLSPIILILSPFILPELLEPDPATYAQTMYYVEMKPEK